MNIAESAAALASLYRPPRWNAYIPHKPTPKQAVFLSLPHVEAFFGGAAGGGKSDALLMAALQYVDIPYYSAIIFRRKLTDAKKPNAILDRAQRWLAGTDCKWNGSEHRFLFPSGASLTFGYIDSMQDAIISHQSAEYQYVGFDELTQFESEEWYTYLFSRLRHGRCPEHENDIRDDCLTCREYGKLATVPLRMRSASNPGGLGHFWVRKRFDIKPVTLPDGRTIYRGCNPKAPHVPAFYHDNEFLDEDYHEKLNLLDPVTREQLKRGDWGVSADGRFKKSWFRYYSRRGDFVAMGRNGSGVTWHPSKCRCFITADTAASTKAGPGDAYLSKAQPSWTVIQTWWMTPHGDLLLYDQLRFQKEVPDVTTGIIAAFIHARDNHRTPDAVIIENAPVAKAVITDCVRQGLPVRAFNVGHSDKLQRAYDAILRAEQGRIWLPEQTPLPQMLSYPGSASNWLDEWEGEVFVWLGHDYQVADQIDAMSMAAIEVSNSVAHKPAVKQAVSAPYVHR